MNDRFSALALSARVHVIVMAMILGGCTERTEMLAMRSSVYLERTQFDMGTFRETDEPVAKIVLHNDQETMLRLTQLELSCGCMTTNFQPTEVTAGGQYEFEVRLSNPQLGTGVQRGELLTDPPQKMPLEFFVEYRVEPSAYVFPRAIALGTISLDTTNWPIERTLVVKDQGTLLQLVGLPDVEYRGQSQQLQRLNYSATSPPEWKDGSEIKLTILPREEAQGTFNDRIRIAADTEKGPIAFNVLVFGYLAPDDVKTEETGQSL